MELDVIKEPKKVSSIARKINFRYVTLLFSEYLSMDILIFIILLIVLVIGIDIEQLGSFEFNRFRTLSFNDTLSDTVYMVGNSSTDILYMIPFGSWSVLGIVAASVIGTMQLISVISLSIKGPAKVRGELGTLNELARKAQELSELAFNQTQETSFDEEKYHNLEDAISSLKVDRPDAQIHMNDKELRGIETALNDLLDRMRTSYKQQTQFVSDASHELRTPIAVIQGYVNMLDRWGKQDEAILDESIEAIKNEANHMQKLVEQLLFLARGDSNRQVLDMQNINLNGIMREVYEESLMIDEKHIYRFEDKGDAVCFGDADMLKQSARILIDNAAKYTPEGEEIIIRVGACGDDNTVFYQIQDNGIGMNQTDVEHAFDRFYRADVVRNNKTGGTGLGLSIARWIIDKHQGHIEIKSCEGIGTRFSVFFPKVL